MKEYYSDDSCTIYHGDALHILPQLTDMDLVFTSPPYNLGVKAKGGSGMHAGSLAARDLTGGYGTYADDMDPTEYDQWQTEIVHQLWGALSNDGAIFYNHKPRAWGGQMLLPTRFGVDLPVRQIVIWDKGMGMNFSQSFFLPKHEWIVIWAKSAWRLIDKSTSQLGDVWSVPPETNSRHPAPFPLTLPTMAIGATAARTILDPFMGSGTTLRAAKDLGRKAIGIEIEERYCEIAAKRLGQGVLDFDGTA